jgi:hypothetical protein
MHLRSSRLRRGEVLAGVGALLMTGFLFALPWQERGTEPGQTISRTGWEALPELRWLILLAIVAALGLVLAQAAFRAPALPVAMSTAATALGALTVLGLIYCVVLSPVAHQQSGAYLQLAAAVLTALGSYLSLRQEGISAADAPREIPTVAL